MNNKDSFYKNNLTEKKQYVNDRIFICSCKGIESNNHFSFDEYTQFILQTTLLEEALVTKSWETADEVSDFILFDKRFADDIISLKVVSDILEDADV